MKYRNFLFSVCCLLLAGSSYGQTHVPTTYGITPRDAAWINKRGFPMTAYDWQNETINLQLQQAAQYRRQSRRCWRYGAMGYLVGGIVVSAVSLGSIGTTGDQAIWRDATFKVGVAIGTGGLVAAIGGGIWKKVRARHRVRDAVRRYY